jgi:hypothetical protein
MSDVRTIVTFQSTAFNTSQPRDYFIDECCHGDDLAHWLIAELRGRGVPTDDEPNQEDFGWYFGFRVADTDYQLVLGYRPGEMNGHGEWVGWLERKLGFVKSLLGRRKHHIGADAACLLQSVLSWSPQIRNVRWHYERDFDRGKEDDARPEPRAD